MKPLKYSLPQNYTFFQLPKTYFITYLWWYLVTNKSDITGNVKHSLGFICPGFKICVLLRFLPSPHRIIWSNMGIVLGKRGDCWICNHTFSVLWERQIKFHSPPLHWQGCPNLTEISKLGQIKPKLSARYC